MDQTTEDVQGNALYGDQQNTSLMNAQSLNPAAESPTDWTTVLCNGISGAATIGTALASAAAQQSQVNNAIAPAPLSCATPAPSGSILPLVLIAAVLYMAVK